jgi:hypothetical protein
MKPIIGTCNRKPTSQLPHAGGGYQRTRTQAQASADCRPITTRRCLEG